MSDARSFCEEVARNKEQLKDPLTSFVEGFSPATIIKEMLKPLTSANDAESLVTNKVEQNLDASTKLSFRSECNNSATITNSNVFDPTECAKALGCERMGTPGLSDKQVDNYFKMCTFGNVTQTNKNTVRQNCAMDAAIKALKTAELDTKLMAVMEKMQEAKGLMANNSGKSKSCNDIKTNVDASTYVNSFKACANNFNTENSNFATCVSNTNQQNVNDAFQSCMDSSNIYEDTGTKVTTGTSMKDSVTQYATGIQVAACLAVLCCCLLMGLGAYLMLAT